MTRQNVTPGLREVLTEPCPVCGGEGRVRSEESALADVERSLQRLAALSALPVLTVEVHPRMLGLIIETAVRTVEQKSGKCIVVQRAPGSVPLDHCLLVSD